MKKITFYSFGHRFLDCYPKPPKKTNVRQFVFDVRDMSIETFNVDMPPDSGLVKKMQDIVIGHCRGNGYLDSMEAIIEQAFRDLISRKEDREIKIYFGCAGGWQRSVALAEYFKNYCKKIWAQNCSSKFMQLPIRARHLTINRWKDK